jgi:hypothetical protein
MRNIVECLRDGLFTPAQQVSALGLVAGLLYRDFRRERVNDKRPFFRAKLNENKAAA